MYKNKIINEIASSDKFGEVAQAIIGEEKERIKRIRERFIAET